MKPRAVAMSRALATVILAGPPVQRAVPTARPGPFDVTYYALHISVDPAAGRIAGTASVEARITTSGTTAIRLDLTDSLAVDSVRVNGHRVAAIHRGGVLVVPLGAGSRAARIEVAYGGHPPSHILTFAGDAAHPRISTYGLPYSARGWFPCRDTPADKADSADLVITVPAPLVVASNGRLVSRTSGANETTTFHWAVRYPIYPDVMSLAIADYATFNLDHTEPDGKTLPMMFFAFREDSAKAAADFSVEPRILTFYESIYGPYPFAREKYGVAEFTTRSFREHQTIPSYGAALITGDHRNDDILAHELAHQWFGNSLSVSSWSDVWLNESLAQFSALLWREHSQGRPAYDKMVAAMEARNIPGALYLPDTANVDAMFTPLTFQKGPVVLAKLRALMGDTAFFNALRSYVHDHAYRNVTTADFEREAEKAYGRPLTAFFDQWVWGGARHGPH